MIVQYVRDETNNPFGCVVAIKGEGVDKYRVGYSMKHPADRWNPNLAKKIAIDRAVLLSPIETRGIVKDKVRSYCEGSGVNNAERFYKFNNLFYTIEKVIQRANKYFK